MRINTTSHKVIGMPAEFDRDAVFALGHIIALANIVERVKFHHQMVHPGARPLSESETVMAWVHVHEVDRDRRPNEVADLEAQKVLIECQGSVDVGHHEHGMSHALCPGAKTSGRSLAAERFAGDFGAVECLHTVARGIAERNDLGDER